MSGRPRYNFPRWNYGYTLGPPSRGGNGDYSTYNSFGPPMPPFGPPMRMMFRGGRPPRWPGYGPPQQPDLSQAEGEEEQEEEGHAEDDPSAAEAPSPVKVKEEPTDEQQQQQQQPVEPTAAEASGETATEERPLSVILHGRNPIMFCNDQSKIRGLHMEWEQVSETGPPHDKTFTWSLKMGDMTTLGSANSKKSAKNKAAEEMAKKLDALPRASKRSFHQMNNFNGFNNFYHPRMMPPMPPPWIQQQMMKRRREFAPGFAPPIAPEDSVNTPDDCEAVGPPPPQPLPVKVATTKTINPSQNNPISKLYEYCKRVRLPEPLFETVSEVVLESRKTQQGFLLKKTEFTIQCKIQGKTFMGNAMNKKQAKYNAAEAAWAELGAGVAQDSISSLLQSHRNTCN